MENKLEANLKPGNGIPERRLFFINTLFIDGEYKNVGFTDPEGRYYPLEEGEELIEEGGGDTPERKTFIQNKNGEKIPFEEWKLGKKESNERDVNISEKIEQLSKGVDRGLLKNIVERTGAQMLYGKDFELNNEMRKEIEVVGEIMLEYLKIKKESEEWEKLQELIKEGAKKGKLISFAGFPPHWLIDGGENSSVEKIIREDGNAGIRVSTEIYDLYYWDGIANDLIEAAKISNDALRGKTTMFLNENLRNASSFFKKNNLIE